MLTHQEGACSKRTESVCNLGHDPIVNAQDYKIENVQVSPADIQGDKAKVTARFLNMGGTYEVRYEFIREAAPGSSTRSRVCSPRIIAGG